MKPTIRPSLLAGLCAALALALPTPARAQTSYPVSSSVLQQAMSSAFWDLFRVWKCVHASGAACTTAELANPWYKQVVVLSSGFVEAERSTFWGEFDKLVPLMTAAASSGSVWSVQKRNQLLFVGYFVPGAALGTPGAAFAGAVATHPIRGYALTLDQGSVYGQIDVIRYNEIPQLRPLSAGVLFNTFQTPVTANASPPGFVNRPFGVAKFTRYDLRDGYVSTHELAHAGLNFLDEYVEQGFQDLSIKQIDIATPLVLFDGSWGGFIKAISDLLSVYDYNLSEVLANNGNDNMSTSAWPTTVWTPGYNGQNYAYEGGMFFGRGTFHQAGSNLMNSDFVMRGWDDGFSYAHSPSQQQVVDEAFDGYIRRPNDRLRNAGPKNGWPLVLGSTTHVMLMDGDKNHHFHPSQAYAVQVGWYDRQWHTCWKWGVIPYACYNDVWTTAMNWVSPEYRAINLKLSSAYGIASLAQKLACQLGITDVPMNGTTFKLCDQSLDTMTNNFLPTITFPVPYQDVPVPASQWFTTYWWHFATWNGQTTSGWTGWSSFYRSL